MTRRALFPACLAAAAVLHAVPFLAVGEGGTRAAGSGSSGSGQVTLAAASAALAQQVREWNRPPQIHTPAPANAPAEPPQQPVPAARSGRAFCPVRSAGRQFASACGGTGRGPRTCAASFAAAAAAARRSGTRPIPRTVNGKHAGASRRQQPAAGQGRRWRGCGHRRRFKPHCQSQEPLGRSNHFADRAAETPAPRRRGGDSAAAPDCLNPGAFDGRFYYPKFRPR